MRPVQREQIPLPLCDHGTARRDRARAYAQLGTAAWRMSEARRGNDQELIRATEGERDRMRAALLRYAKCPRCGEWMRRET